ncbi:MAG: VWA domain-containing protein [Cyclobacteriaceae bacterium]
MKGFTFSQHIPVPKPDQASFESLSKIFFELLNYTSGNVAEALEWLNELDNQYKLTSDEYSMGNFIDDLKKEGYISDANQSGEFEITAKSEQTIRKSALEEIFGKLKKGPSGNHSVTKTGAGNDFNSDTRPFQFGDSLDSLDMTKSIQNAQINHGIDGFKMTTDDLEVREKDHRSQASTVLMIDISHSMILYGEDRITPAKKVAMALAELVKTKYPKDTLDIIVFGNDAWPITIKDLPYLKVGPYHTNTYAGLQLAVDILRRRKTTNKQIFMITDGKPTCLKEGTRYYQNSFGLDRKVINKTLDMAAQCKRLKIPITTFMIAKDPHLQQFVREFTEVNNGRAYYSSLNGLGEYIFEDFINNRKKNYR